MLAYRNKHIHFDYFVQTTAILLIYSICVRSLGDQNAINDLMQMRLSAGGGGGMMAEKLEVRGFVFSALSPFNNLIYYVNSCVFEAKMPCQTMFLIKGFFFSQKITIGLIFILYFIKLVSCVSMFTIFTVVFSLSVSQALITQTRAKQAAVMSEVEWRGRTVPVKIDKARIFLLGLADNEAAIIQVYKLTHSQFLLYLHVVLTMIKVTFGLPVVKNEI